MQKRIGDFFVERGVITDDQRHQILSYASKTGLRFGEAGCQLGLISREKLVELFGPDNSVDLFQLDSRFFPESTRDLVPVESLLRWGAVLLGYKTESRLFKRPRTVLNIGLLNPGNAEAVAQIQKAALSRLGEGAIHGIKIFLVLADQYLDVVRDVYALSDSELRRRNPSEIDGTLTLFLETAP